MAVKLSHNQSVCRIFPHCSPAVNVRNDLEVCHPRCVLLICGGKYYVVLYVSNTTSWFYLCGLVTDYYIFHLPIIRKDQLHVSALSMKAIFRLYK
jgi:hypothetical protein